MLLISIIASITSSDVEKEQFDVHSPHQKAPIINFALIMFSNNMGLHTLSDCHTGHIPEKYM